MQIETVLEHFAAMVTERLDARVFTTEDSIRYTFWAAASICAGVRPIEVVLEHPHSVIAGAEIDTILQATPERTSAAIEFKYDRGNPGGTSQNRTQRAASVLVDVFRLAKIPDTLAARRYLVYITDAEMLGYFKNPANRLHGFFDLPGPAPLTLCPAAWVGFPQTFRDRVDSHACECQVKAVFAAELPQSVSMRVFEVLPPNPAPQPAISTGIVPT